MRFSINNYLNFSQFVMLRLVLRLKFKKYIQYTYTVYEIV